MDFGALIFITLSLVVFILILFYVVRVITAYQKKNIESLHKDESQVGFVIGTFQDLVLKLKEKEKELEELTKRAEDRASSVEMYNEDILQSVPSGVVSFNEEMEVTKINAAAKKILEVTGGDVAGLKYTDVFGKPVCDILQNQHVERAEIAYVTKSGKRIWLGLNISPLKDSGGSIIGRILVFTDLTELKAFQSQMELRERLSTLGEMSAGIAHELRNPMAVIKGYTKLLMKKVDPGQVTAVEAISKEVGVMDRIITDFLSFAKPAEPMFAEVDLKELIEGCISTVTDRRPEIYVSADTGELQVVKGDEIMLRQAFTNLLQNAVESMPDGGELRVISAVAGNGYLNITISDTGHGIPSNIKDKIFLPFFTTKEKGTGLGLPIVHKIIVAHGGTVKVDSDDKGAVFVVRFPLNSTL